MAGRQRTGGYVSGTQGRGMPASVRGRPQTGETMGLQGGRGAGTCSGGSGLGAAGLAEQQVQGRAVAAGAGRRRRVVVRWWRVRRRVAEEKISEFCKNKITKKFLCPLMAYNRSKNL